MCVVPILQINDVNVNDIATQPPGPRYVRESRVSWLELFNVNFGS